MELEDEFPFKMLPVQGDEFFWQFSGGKWLQLGTSNSTTQPPACSSQRNNKFDSSPIQSGSRVNWLFCSSSNLKHQLRSRNQNHHHRNHKHNGFRKKHGIHLPSTILEFFAQTITRRKIPVSWFNFITSHPTSRQKIKLENWRLEPTCSHGAFFVQMIWSGFQFGDLLRFHLSHEKKNGVPDTWTMIHTGWLRTGSFISRLMK